MSKAGRKVMRELLWEGASMDPNSVEVMGYISMVVIDDIPSATNMVSRNGRTSKNGALSTGPRNVHQRDRQTDPNKKRPG